MSLRFFFLTFLALAAACSDGAEPSADQPANTSGDGRPSGYQACFDEHFASYLDSCVVASDCAGVMQCDQSRKFSQSPRCHARICEEDSECEDEMRDLCTGGDFHFECRASNARVPKECRLVEGARS